MLLGRLHHRNLVNLVGYCADKGQHMLMYFYMSKGSLASHLYSESKENLNWGLRVYIALDVARGLEYLHDGAFPPVINTSRYQIFQHSVRRLHENRGFYSKAYDSSGGRLLILGFQGMRWLTKIQLT